jgi:hypothetical protein
LKLIEQPSSCRHCKETARGLVSRRQRPAASPRCIRFEGIEHAENNARALARIPASRRRGKQRRPTKPDTNAKTPPASRGTLSDRWPARPRRRSCDRIRPENGRPARSDVAGAGNGNGNGRRRLPGRVLMGPEQIQRRFLPIGRTGVPLGRPRREPQTPCSSTGATWKSGTRLTRTTPRRTWSSVTGADGEEGQAVHRLRTSARFQPQRRARSVVRRNCIGKHAPRFGCFMGSSACSAAPN